MSEFPDILSASVVSDDINVFWEAYKLSGEQKQINTLVLSSDFQKDSVEEIQLTKILQACNINPEDLHILKLKKDQRLAWFSIRETWQPKVVISLGIDPSHLGISALFRLNAPNRFDDCIIIPSIGLSELEQQPAQKKDLWLEGLKPVFIDHAWGEIQ